MTCHAKKQKTAFQDLVLIYLYCLRLAFDQFTKDHSAEGCIHKKQQDEFQVTAMNFEYGFQWEPNL